MGLPWWLSAKGFACQHRRHRRHKFNPWVRKILWWKKWQPTPVFLPGKSHEQRRLVGYSPWGHKESDITEWAQHTHFLIHWKYTYEWMKINVMGYQNPLIIQILCPSSLILNLCPSSIFSFKWTCSLRQWAGCSGQSSYLVCVTLYSSLQCHWRPGILSLAACV